MKALFFSIVCLVCFSSHAAFSLENSCIWDGEPTIKKMVIDEKLNWLEAVYQLHTEGGEVSGDFEGVGSCRFVPRDLGGTAQEVIENYVAKGFSITPTRAYLKLTGDKTKFVVPSAGYSFTTNYMVVKKDFYPLGDVVACKKKMADTVTFGQSTQSIDLRLVDVVYKTDADGISAVINGHSPEGNVFGICHFHSI